jgi:hypothetical protein
VHETNSGVALMSQNDSAHVGHFLPPVPSNFITSPTSQRPCIFSYPLASHGPSRSPFTFSHEINSLSANGVSCQIDLQPLDPSPFDYSPENIARTLDNPKFHQCSQRLRQRLALKKQRRPFHSKPLSYILSKTAT